MVGLGGRTSKRTNMALAGSAKKLGTQRTPSNGDGLEDFKWRKSPMAMVGVGRRCVNVLNDGMSHFRLLEQGKMGFPASIPNR